MLIERIWAATDGRNCHYLIACAETGEALVVDPLNADAVIARSRALGWTIRQIFNTHEHRDHTGMVAMLVGIEDLADRPSQCARARDDGVGVERIHDQCLAGLGAGNQVVEIAAFIGSPDALDQHVRARCGPAGPASYPWPRLCVCSDQPAALRTATSDR